MKHAQDIYTFPEGLYGLEDQKRFVIVQPDETLPFAYLQSVDEPEISLLITNPFVTYQQYEFDLSEQDLATLQHPTLEQVIVWVTVSAKESFQDATVNLLAPIVFNMEKRLGRQVVLHERQLSTRAPLFGSDKEGK